MFAYSVFSIALSVLTITALLSLIAALTGLITRGRFPALEHTCWVIVLIRLIMPPIIPVTVPGFPSVSMSPQTFSDPREISDEETRQPDGTTTENPNLASAESPQAPFQVSDDNNTPNAQQSSRFPIATGDAPRKTSTDAETGHFTQNNPGANDVPQTSSPEWKRHNFNRNLNEISSADLGTDAKESFALHSRSTEKDLAPTAASPEALAPRMSFLSLGPVLLAIWGCGSIVRLWCAGRAMVSFNRLMRLSVEPSPELQAATSAIAARIGLGAVPQVRAIQANISPLVWSRAGQPVVIVPQHLSLMNDPHTRDLLLAHELAHIHRGDHLVRWLEFLTQILWWWCPLLWIAQSRLRFAEERACDAWVLRLWPARALDYARCIVDTVAFVAEAQQSPLLTTSGIGSVREIQARLRSLTSQPGSTRRGWAGTMAASLLAVVCCPLMLTGGDPASVTQGSIVITSSDGPATSRVSEQENSLKNPKPLSSVNTVTQLAQSPPMTVELLPTTPQVANEQKAATAPLAKKTDQTASEVPLPPGADASFAARSPDQKSVAFVGSMIQPDGTVKSGLFHFDPATRSTRCLIEKALKTRPSWSPDSKQITIGNSPGYGNIYPLVIVDAIIGTVVDTGVQGASAVWSPNGRYLATPTQFGNGGTWVGGVPADGRIGIWDTQTRKLTTICPAGVNLQDREGRISFRSGSLVPAWSPDGRWVAWRQLTSERHGHNAKENERNEIWVAQTDGSDLRRVFQNCLEFRWNSDSTSLLDVKAGTTKKLADGAIALPADWPQVPAELVTLLRQETEGMKRAAAFQAAPVLAANRLWQNPTLDGIESIEFTHRMQPTRLDERFLWSKTGDTYIEVLRRDRADGQYTPGWSILKTAEGGAYRSSGPDAFPRYTSPEETAKAKSNARRQRPLSSKEIQRLDALRHLSGTRLNFTSIGWGRQPANYIVTDVSEQGALKTIELRPRPGTSRDCLINAGAMFATTSYAYMHDVAYHRSVLTIDAQNRITREVSYLADDTIVEIDLLNWITGAEGQSAPGRINLYFPNRQADGDKRKPPPQEFHVEQEFTITPEGLWILKAGRSWFGTQEPETQQIVDLKLNAGADELNQLKSQVQQRLQELTPEVRDAPTVDLKGLTPFELGAVHTFDLPAADALADFRPLSLSFFPDGVSHDMALTAELRFPTPQQDHPPTQNDLLLALFDEYKQPQSVMTIPAVVATAAESPAKEVLQAVTAQHQIWLRGGIDPRPVAAYTFHQGTQAQSVSLPNKYEHARKGITLTSALFDRRIESDQCRIPVALTADWNGRPVKVFAVTGRHFSQLFGSGLSTGQGYTGSYFPSSPSSVLLVVDAKTGFPLIERSDSMELQFLEYVAASAGQFVPLRIVCRTALSQVDLRFQLLNNRLWLFDRVAASQPAVTSFIDQITIEGQDPQTRVRSQEPDPTIVPADLNWKQVTNRLPLRDGDLLSASFASVEQPWRHPAWQALNRMTTVVQTDGTRMLRCNLQTWPPSGNTKYWSLTRITPAGPETLTCFETLSASAATRVVVSRANFNQPQYVPPQPESNLKPRSPGTRATNPDEKTFLRQFTLTRDPAAGIVFQPIIVSTSRYKDEMALISALIVGPDGVIQSGGTGSDEFRVQDTPIVLNTLRISISEPRPHADGFVLTGCRSVVIGMPIGSTWGRLTLDDPVFKPMPLISSRYPRIREAGWHQLERTSGIEAYRHFERSDRNHDAAALRQAYAPYQPFLTSSLSEKSDDTEAAIASACRQAGLSQSPELIDRLRARFHNRSDQIQDSAAIGLGLLGQRDGIDRLRNLAKEPIPDDASLNAKRQVQTEARWALEKLGG